MRVQHPVFSMPLLSNRLLKRVIDEIGKGCTERWIPWTIKLGTMGLDDSEKEALQELLVFLFRQLRSFDGDPSPFLRGFQTFLLDHHIVNPIHVLATLAQFEETAAEIIRRNLDKNDAEQACTWIRSLALNLKYAAFELMYLPAGPIPDRGGGWISPFVRLLNRTAPREQWEWVALFTFPPRFRILDVAVRDVESFEWKTASRTPELTRQVINGMEGQTPSVLRETVVSGIGLAAGGATDAAARHRLAQIAQWLKLAFDLSVHTGGYRSPGADRLQLYEAVLQFDESLLQCKDLEDVIASTVEHVCRIGGFRRSALFWYTPLTRTVEGVHAFNIRREDILRIREPAENLSGVQEVVKTNKPVYFENVTHRLPEHYVETFRLTSLVACPIAVAPRRPTAILLLDQDGTPFHPDERTITILDALLSRVAKTIHTRLRSPVTRTETPSSRVLTRREQQILQLIADGLDTKDISKHLHLSEYTVSEYVGTILRKLGASNRPQAVAKAFRQHLLH